VFGFGMMDPPAIRAAMGMIRQAMAEGEAARACRE